MVLAHRLVSAKCRNALIFTAPANTYRCRMVRWILYILPFASFFALFRPCFFPLSCVRSFACSFVFVNTFNDRATIRYRNNLFIAWVCICWCGTCACSHPHAHAHTHIIFSTLYSLICHFNFHTNKNAHTPYTREHNIPSEKKTTYLGFNKKLCER